MVTEDLLSIASTDFRWGSPSVDKWRYRFLYLVSNRLLLGSLTSVDRQSWQLWIQITCIWLLMQMAWISTTFLLGSKWMFLIVFIAVYLCMNMPMQQCDLLVLSFSFCCLLEVYWCGYGWQFANFLSVYPLREGKLAKACLISRPNLFVFENQVLQIIFLGALSKAISQHLLMMG